MVRVDIEWSIEGRKGTKSGKLYGLHPQEVMGAEQALRLRTRRGDTVQIKKI